MAVAESREPGQRTQAAADDLQPEPGCQAPAQPPFGQPSDDWLRDGVEPEDLVAVEAQTAQMPDIARVFVFPATGVEKILDPAAGVDDQGPRVRHRMADLVSPLLLRHVEQRGLRPISQDSHDLRDDRR
jgi:hypothetical protein